MPSEVRWLDAAGAATYLSLRQETFNKRVRHGLIPEGSRALGNRSARWSTEQLEALMKGEQRPAGSAIEGIRAYVEQLAEKGSRRQASARGRVG